MNFAQMHTPNTWPQSAWRSAALALGAAALLSACGSGQGDPAAPASAKSAQLAQDQDENPTHSAQTRLHAQGAALNTAELQRAAQSAPAGLDAGKAMAQAAASALITAHRFYNTQTGAHFYTTSEEEKTSVQNTLPQFQYEGPAFYASGAAAEGLSPVHRFFNTQTGVHFYTISEDEKASVQAHLPQYRYEGVGFYASKVAGTDLVQLYRFYLAGQGSHFYTTSQTERDSVIAHMQPYTDEGVGFYVLAPGWGQPQPVQGGQLPHTGVTDQQCFEADGPVQSVGRLNARVAPQAVIGGQLVACNSPGADALNTQQDGDRAAINPMTYSPVPNPAGGQFANTECVKDEVTGLIWEGKTDDGGLRDVDKLYTHLGGGAADDASGYVAAVNASSLCGFNDWRLPTRNELLNLVDYGKVGIAPIDTTAFVNTQPNQYWSADGVSNSSSIALQVSFEPDGGYSQTLLRSFPLPVRLVRGSAASGPRYSFSTVAYGSDAADNVVNDAWTGLQWRRCEEGRVWSGSACSGSASNFTHEQALGHARDQSGWRLPNVKEFSSLVDLSQSSGAYIDAAAFPGAQFGFLWSSSPNVGGSVGAWNVNFGSGAVDRHDRISDYAVRLVRASP